MMKRIVAQTAVLGVGALALIGLGAASNAIAGREPLVTPLVAEDSASTLTTLKHQLKSTRQELERAHQVLEYSGRYAIPADLSAPGPALTQVRTAAGVVVSIVPGLIAETALPDVMRGEESQLLGALAGTDGAPGGGDADERIVILPGTHSKWVRVLGTTVTAFTTCMTGELYALLMNDSTLALLAVRADVPDWTAFERGVEIATSATGYGGILNTAFSARTMVLTGALAPEQVGDYVSGLLIGHELAGVGASWLAGYSRDVLLCGSAQLNDRYRRALELRGATVALAAPRPAAAGMWHVAVAAGLVREPAAVGGVERATRGPERSRRDDGT